MGFAGREWVLFFLSQEFLSPHYQSCIWTDDVSSLTHKTPQHQRSDWICSYATEDTIRHKCWQRCILHELKGVLDKVPRQVVLLLGGYFNRYHSDLSQTTKKSKFSRIVCCFYVSKYLANVARSWRFFFMLFVDKTIWYYSYVSL